MIKTGGSLHVMTSRFECFLDKSETKPTLIFPTYDDRNEETEVWIFHVELNGLHFRISGEVKVVDEWHPIEFMGYYFDNMSPTKMDYLIEFALDGDDDDDDEEGEEWKKNL